MILRVLEVAPLCVVFYKVYSYYDFGKDIKKIMIKTRLNIVF